MEEELLKFKIMIARLRVENDTLQRLVSQDFSVRENGLWVHLGRVEEAVEVCENIDEFRDWINEVKQHFDDLMRSRNG